MPFDNGLYEQLAPGVAGVPGHLQAYEHFGAALFGPGDGTFLAGAPGANVGKAALAGQVFSFALNGNTLSYDPADATAFDESALHQAAAAGDGFGGVIGAGSHIAFGIPHKSPSGVHDAGEVVFVDNNTPRSSLIVQRFVQGSNGVPGTPETGDEMGGALPA